MNTELVKKLLQTINFIFYHWKFIAAIIKYPILLLYYSCYIWIFILYLHYILFSINAQDIQ